MFHHLRNKLALAFALPLVLLLVVAGLAVSSSATRSSSVSEETNLATATAGPSGVITALQNERNEAALSLVGAAGASNLGVSSNAEARQVTDQAISTFRNTIEHDGSATQQTFQQVLNSLSGLGALRHEVDGFDGARTLTDPQAQTLGLSVFAQYRTVIDGFLNAVSAAPLRISDATLRTGVEALDAYLHQAEALAVVSQDLFVSTWSVDQTGAAPRAVTTAADFGQYQTWTARLSALGVGSYSGPVTAIVAQGNGTVSALQSDVQDAVQGKPVNLLELLKAVAPPSGQAHLTPSQVAANALAVAVAHRASALQRKASDETYEFAALALAALILCGFILLRVSSSISRPLAALARAAQDVADVQLPGAVGAVLDAEPGAAVATPQVTPIVVSSHDEVAEVAGALNAVHQRAVDLAVDQAALRRNVADAFLNLGRRNQNLVARQLDLITQLEQDEDDPATMEELFRLDHLAARMRRNAESLLVMAGTGTATQWAEAASAVDVVRAASAGVEDYRRLQLRHFDHAVIAAAATGDVVHILAELMENALSFSPPHAVVELYGRALPTGYTISVVDAGIGMTTQERESANTRLLGQGNLNDAASRYLGLVVAGRLAARQGITVSLHEADAGGIAARLRIPPELIESSVAGPAAGERSPVSLPRVSPEEFAGLPSADQLIGQILAPGPDTSPDAGPDRVAGGAFPNPGFDAVSDTPTAPALATSGALSWPSPPSGGLLRPNDPASLLPRRVPGAALPYADDALRRGGGPVEPPNHQALSAALSDYLRVRSDSPSPDPSAPTSPNEDNR